MWKEEMAKKTNKNQEKYKKKYKKIKLGKYFHKTKSTNTILLTKIREKFKKIIWT